MGRGEHPRQNHHNILNNITYWKMLGSIYFLFANKGYKERKKIKAYGQLVLLGFDVTTFTPVAYQRHSL